MGGDIAQIIKAFQTHDWIGLLLLVLVWHGKERVYEDMRFIVLYVWGTITGALRFVFRKSNKANTGTRF